MSDLKEQSSTMEVEPVASDIPKTSTNKKFKQKPKGNNSAARRQEAFRERTGQKVLEDYRRKQNKKFLGNMANLQLFNLPEGLTLAQPTTSIVRMPVSTYGISLTVNELWNRFHDQFRNYCSIYQLFRVALAQFEFQRFIAVQQSLSVYPYDSVSFHFPSEFRNVLRAHPDNFEAIVHIVDSIGLVKHGEVQYVPTVPNQLLPAKTHLTFTRLQQSVSEWANDYSNWKFNPLPGARVEIAEDFNGVLLNPEDFWPDGYNADLLRTDAVAVMGALESMRAKYEQVASKCSFNGIGKPSMLVSVSDPRMSIPFVSSEAPSIRPSSRKRHAPSSSVAEVPFTNPSASVESCTWYTGHPLDNQMMHLGAFSLVGLTTDEAERDCPALRVRDRFSCARRLEDSWLTLFDWLTPRVARN